MGSWLTVSGRFVAGMPNLLRQPKVPTSVIALD